MAMFSLCSRIFRKSGRKNRRLDIATDIKPKARTESRLTGIHCLLYTSDSQATVL